MLKIRHLVDRKSVVAERVDVEASYAPDARAVFAAAKLARREAEEAAALAAMKAARGDGATS